MAQIHKTTADFLDPNGQVNIAAMMIPSFRTVRAAERGVEKNIMIKTQGGLGDVICAEPAIRYGVNIFKAKGSEVSLDTFFPELFGHITDLKEINHSAKHIPDYLQYLLFDTLYTTEVLHWEFIAHMFTQVVDHHSIVMWRSQLPIADRSIKLVPSKENYEVADLAIDPKKAVLIHAGRTWQSRTVPTYFWNQVIPRLVEKGVRPVLIGKESFGMVGNLPVDSTGCLDLRNTLSLMETVAVTHRAKVLLTNDSSPIHMAASGDAWIGFISTVKFPEFITHWRHGIFGWRMQNWSKGGVWQTIDMCPNSSVDIRVDTCDPELLKSWLPDPVEYADWAVSKLRESQE